MVKVIYTKEFQRLFSKLKDWSLRERVIKQIEKIADNPDVGKPMRHGRKGTREFYVGSHRLSYEFFKHEDKVYLLDLYHKDEQ
jgi:mRNA-degrading endonuclease RelE of RelBE toxin-antitoxin system